MGHTIGHKRLQCSAQEAYWGVDPLQYESTFKSLDYFFSSLLMYFDSVSVCFSVHCNGSQGTLQLVPIFISLSSIAQIGKRNQTPDLDLKQHQQEELALTGEQPSEDMTP